MFCKDEVIGVSARLRLMEPDPVAVRIRKARYETDRRLEWVRRFYLIGSECGPGRLHIGNFQRQRTARSRLSDLLEIADAERRARHVELDPKRRLQPGLPQADHVAVEAHGTFHVADGIHDKRDRCRLHSFTFQPNWWAKPEPQPRTAAGRFAGPTSFAPQCALPAATPGLP